MQRSPVSSSLCVWPLSLCVCVCVCAVSFCPFVSFDAVRAKSDSAEMIDVCCWCTEKNNNDFFVVIVMFCGDSD